MCAVLLYYISSKIFGNLELLKNCGGRSEILPFRLWGDISLTWSVLNSSINLVKNSRVKTPYSKRIFISKNGSF